MQRIHVIPEWAGSPYQFFAFNFCKKNAWRVSHVVGDVEDCVQECWVLFDDCKRWYGATIKTKAQFMYIFKTAVKWKFDTLSVKDTKLREGQQFFESKHSDISVVSNANLAANLSHASSELKQVLNIFMNAPNEVMETLRADAPSTCPRQFFKSVMKICGIQESKSIALTKELNELLS